jgi:The Golgi pH Regulator (GPHR) Family N-terminal
LIVRFDVQRSIANIAVLGTICAAVISGFATVFFPLEQLLIFRGVDAEQLRRRERSLSQLLREIATRKKEFLIISKTPSPPYTPKQAVKTAGIESLAEIDSSIESETTKNKFSAAFDTMDRELDEHSTKKTKNIPGIPLEIKQNNVVHCCSMSHSNFKLVTLSKNVLLLEELSAILFTEIIALKEQQHMAEMARTKWGRVMRFLGQILT